MRDVALGVLAIAGGAVFCFRGVFALRVVITVWGAFVGFSLGAGLVAAITDEFWLTKPIGWLAGLVLGLLFAALAYLYYEVAVVIATASAGFAAGVAIMVALGVSWNWLIVLVALAVGAAVGVFALRVDLPSILLIVLSATAGATAIVGGLMLLTGTLDGTDLSNGHITEVIRDDWWTYLLYLGLAIAGVLSQQRAKAWADARAAWAVNAART